MSDFIPQEVVSRILANLPPDSLIKCTLVCKTWHSLITSPCFIDTHLAKTLAKPLSSQLILIRRFTESPMKEHYSIHSNGSLDTYQTIKKSPLKARSNLYTRIVVNPIMLRISVNRGMLTVSHYYYGEANRYCDIWERTQYGDVKSWTKLYTIDVLRGAGRVFGLTETGEVLLAPADRTEGGFENFDALLSCFKAKSGNLVLYDPKSRQTNLLVQLQGVIDAFYAGEYIESLVFLDKESGAASYEGATIKEKQKSINSESGGSVEHDLEQVRSMMGSSSNDADEEEEEDNPNAVTTM
ncbi:hypothetical protein COLO4_07202 [Corchorus olitorius]|uniref:F-box domain-containing protein n=1 Tax=Corchorus olitorius TaxID=93759 RepID=A0A1R3KKG8_9ROSI|nr:hypothetical protein COLO4_07202 [Corchorus olitorius]